MQFGLFDPLHLESNGLCESSGIMGNNPLLAAEPPDT